MAKKIMLCIALLLSLSLPVVGLEKYGDAYIKKGTLIIVREGKAVLYQQIGSRIEILKDDVLRVGDKSLVVMEAIDNTILRMGSNAVFHIRPWKQRKESGYLRMLYGKLQFEVKKARDPSNFRLKTATATIGVKGTIAGTEVASNSNTGMTSVEGQPFIIGATGEESTVPENNFSMVVNGNSATSPVLLPTPEPGSSGLNLDKSPAFDPSSANLLQENQLAALGINPGDLEQSKKEQTSLDEGFGAGTGHEDEKVNSGNEEKEKDFQESEQGNEQLIAPEQLQTDTQVNLNRLFESLDTLQADSVTSSLGKNGKVSVKFQH